MPKYADPAVYPVGTPAATDNVMTRTAAGADGNFSLGNLAGIAGLTPSADLSLYYNGTAWATYTVTSVGRTLLAATTQAAQRAAIGAVGTTGNETIAGVKNCTSIWQWDFGTTIGRIEYGSPGGNPGIVFRARDYSTAANFRSDIRGQPGLVRIGASADSNQPTAAFDITPASIRPTNNNFMSCGEASNAWTQVYAQNTTISTSDARLKTEPRQLSEAERKGGSELARLPAIWEWLTGDRLHAGPTVQAAMAVMAAHELDPFAYSFICYDQWEAEEATYDDEGNELTPALEAGDRYSFRKEELLCFMVAALAAENDLQAAKVEALDARLAALEAKA
ncbi:tail fiber domain-containing protein [Stenotrophomonas sp. DR009]|uniref:tail fiber domain-containing protein n=1 Tax=Stenotrophomonas sp. DR009 TaxID=3398461 RepID=UPI003BB14B3D